MGKSSEYSLQKINNYVDSGVSQILSTFKDKAKSKPPIAIIKALSQQIQFLEDGIYKMYESLILDNMSGVFLDRYGKDCNIERSGRNDTDYRELLKANVILRLTAGTPDSVIQAVKIFTGATSVRYDEEYPCIVNIYFVAKVISGKLMDIIKQFLPVGVTLKSITQSLHDNPFILTEKYSEDFVLKVESDNIDNAYSLDNNNNNILKVVSPANTRMNSKFLLTITDIEGNIVRYGGKLVEKIR